MNNLLSGVKFTAKQAKQFGSLGWTKHFCEQIYNLWCILWFVKLGGEGLTWRSWLLFSIYSDHFQQYNNSSHRLHFLFTKTFEGIATESCCIWSRCRFSSSAIINFIELQLFHGGIIIYGSSNLHSHTHKRVLGLAISTWVLSALQSSFLRLDPLHWITINQNPNHRLESLLHFHNCYKRQTLLCNKTPCRPESSFTSTTTSA